MAKAARKKRKRSVIAKRSGKIAGNRAEISENIDCLLQLHKLQGALLGQLRKQV